MSAGGISYSGITNYGKVSLPSVDTWGTNMNILKDPPKSITTRRIDKVGQTSSLTEMIDDSGDRVCEAISLYARGINPSVGVSYNNHGNNGGQRTGGLNYSTNNSSSGGVIGGGIGGGSAFLPYRVMRDGAFRPDVQKPIDLLPYSRMSRVNTSAFTKKGFVDFTKKLIQPDAPCKAILDKTLRTCARPTATYRLGAPVVEAFDVKYVIKNPTKFDKRAGETGHKTQDLTSQVVYTPTKEINENPLNVHNIMAKQGSVRYVDNSHIDTDRYLQDTLHSAVQSKRSQSIQVTPIEDIMDIDIHLKDSMNISHNPNTSGYTKEESMHEDFELDRRVLSTSAIANKHKNIHKRTEIEHQAELKQNRPSVYASTNKGTSEKQITKDFNNRSYTLKPTINAGGMTGRGMKPSQNTGHEVVLRESNQTTMNRRVADLNAGRYGI